MKWNAEFLEWLKEEYSIELTKNDLSQDVFFKKEPTPYGIPLCMTMEIETIYDHAVRWLMSKGVYININNYLSEQDYRYYTEMTIHRKGDDRMICKDSLISGILLYDSVKEEAVKLSFELLKECD